LKILIVMTLTTLPNIRDGGMPRTGDVAARRGTDEWAMKP
jgi:hypothetical protein